MEDNASSHPDTDNTDNPRNAGAKRKRGGSSSRGVANLTPEQLERKRANDREAQRAIRERTKNHIDRLNVRIRELEQSQPYQELQAAVRQKEAVQAENEDMKRKMGQIVAMLQPFLGTMQGLEDLAAAAERNAIPPPDPTLPAVHAPHIPASVQDINSPVTAGTMASPGSQTSVNRQYGLGGIQSGPTRNWPSSATSFDPSSNRNVQSAYTLGDERLGLDFLLENNHHVRSTVIRQSHTSSVPPLMPPAYSILPRTLAASCPLDALLLEFLTRSQRLAAEGVLGGELAGPAYPNFNVLLNPTMQHPAHPLSKFFVDILHTFPDIVNLPEQVAVVYIMFLVMRWQVNPTKENYERMPEWVMPRPSQLLTPHPHWLDYLPWPLLRAALAQQGQNAPHFDTFFIPYTTTISLNWPYPQDGVLIPTMSSPVPGHSPKEELDYVLSPTFEQHLRDLTNWSLGPAFRETFPEWKDLVRIKER